MQQSDWTGSLPHDWSRVLCGGVDPAFVPWTLHGRWMIQRLSSLSIAVPAICPRIQLLGRGLGQKGSTANCATPSGTPGPEASAGTFCIVEDAIPASSIAHADAARTTIDVAKTTRIQLWDRLIFSSPGLREVSNQAAREFPTRRKEYSGYHSVATD